MLAVEVNELVKYYGSFQALKGVSFKVEEGEVYGLIGPNGAGKTTTLRIIATLLKPTSGNVRVFGYDVVENPGEVRKIISYLPEEAGGYKNLKGWEFLEFMARLYGAEGEELREMLKRAGEISGLGDRLNDYIKTYSKGMLRRLLLARALMVNPRLAILDEPTSGMDVMHALYVRDVIKKFVKEHGTTVLLSSHNMLEVEYLCDEVAIIDKGRIVAVGRPDELKEDYGAENLEEVFLKVVSP